MYTHASGKLLALECQFLLIQPEARGLQVLNLLVLIFLENYIASILGLTNSVFLQNAVVARPKNREVFIRLVKQKGHVSYQATLQYECIDHTSPAQCL